MLGKSLEISRWPKNTGFAGVGIGDLGTARHKLAEKIDFIEADLERSCAGVPGTLIDRADVLVCSEVLQHVLPPVQSAFDALIKMIKPCGLLIMTVPYGFETTLEHFPNLHDWKLVRAGGETVLSNTTTSGEKETFSNFRLYEDGKLEMRVFGLEDIRKALRLAGFTEIRIAGGDHLAYGIQFRNPWSLPITARKP